MPDAPPAPAPVRDLGKTPTLLETVAAQFDITGAPVISARSLPSPIKSDGETTPRTKPEEKPKGEEKPKVEEKPKGEESGKKTKEEQEAEQQAEWKKAGETVADKLFRKAGKPKEEKKPEEKTPDKPVDETKPKPKAEEKPSSRRRISEAEITERAAAAAAEATTKALSKIVPRTEAPPPPAKKPEDGLSDAQRKQFDVYQELEATQPTRYKGITTRYLKSLQETQDYVKTWGKEHPGETFNPDDEEHDAFFERVEPEVDEDDWVDAKANIRAKEISSQAVAPVNKKLQEMEQERARTMLEPFLEQKRLEAVHLLLNEFDPQVAEAIRKPDGLKELAEKDPITVSALNREASKVSALASEIVRLEDPKAGINFDPSNDHHRELADFIIGQERRISGLPPHERTHEGKMFIGRQAWMSLPLEERANYWYLTAEHVIYLLAQKHALEAKKNRDAEIAKFNETAERLGYKKIETGKPAGDTKGAKPAEKPAARQTMPSPESISKTSVRTPGGSGGNGTPSESEVILGKLFHTLKS